MRALLQLALVAGGNVLAVALCLTLYAAWRVLADYQARIEHLETLNWQLAASEPMCVRDSGANGTRRTTPSG